MRVHAHDKTEVSKNCRVIFNGEDTSHVVAADDEEGYIEIYSMSLNGTHVINGTGHRRSVATHKCYGHVLLIDKRTGLPFNLEAAKAANGRVCDCGAIKARTTHADWCSTMPQR